jgi:hypothetical protein
MTIEAAKRSADQATGISNVTYDLISIVHNKLQAIAAIEGYRRDAESDSDVMACFDRIVEHERQDLDELRQLLSSRLS